MISKIFPIVRMIVLASFALSSAAGATCSNASLSGTYGFLHDGTDSKGAPATTAVTRITFDSTTGTFTGETTASHEGVIATASLTGTYTIASDCTGTGTPSGGSPFSIVVTSTEFLAVHPFSEGFAVKQGSPTCTNAAVVGSFGFETTGLFLAGTPVKGWVAFIGELKLTVNPSGEGVISGHVASSEGDTALAFAPVTGSYSVAPDCTGTATITPKGQSPLNFSFVVVDCGKEMLAIETDADTVVSGTLQRIALPCCNYEQLSEVVKQAVEAGDALRKNHTLLRRALGLADQKAIEEAIRRDAASRVAGILRASRLANCRQLKL